MSMKYYLRTDENGFRRVEYVNEDGSKLPGDYYMIVYNNNGKPVLNDIVEFVDEYAVVMDRNGKFGTIDRTGNVVIPIEIDRMGRTKYRDLLWFQNEKTFGYISVSGKVKAEFPLMTEFHSVNESVVCITYENGAKTEEINLEKISDSGEKMSFMFDETRYVSEN